MKICHVVDTLNMGGLEKTILEIVFGVKDCVHEVWCLKDKGVLAQDLIRAGVVVREFHFRGRLSFFSVVRLAKALKATGADVIHAHGIYPFMWAGPAAVLARVKFRFVHCQNLHYDLSFRDVIKLRILSRWATKFIAVSEAVKRCLLDFIRIGPEKIVVIYNSATPVALEVTSRRNDMRRSLALGDEDFVVGNISRLEKHKGHSVLVDAVARCRTKGFAVKCLIAGDGPEKEAIQKQARLLGVEGGVFLLGWRRDVQELLSAMDVFVQPSLVTEGLPLALAEAASAGLPLIATSIGGNPEIVQDGFNGCVIAPGDARVLEEKIEYLVTSPDKAKSMGEHSKVVWAQKFSEHDMIQKIYSLYNLG